MRHQFTSAWKMVIALPVILILQACPYTSEVPVTEIPEKIPSAFIGTWYNTEDLVQPVGYRSRYEVSLDTNNYAIINTFEYEQQTKSWSTDVYRVFFSKVNGDYFLNLQSEDDPGNNEATSYDKSADPNNQSDETFSFEPVKGYYIYKVEFEGALLKIKGITTNVTETFSDSKSLYKFIAENKSKSFFYDNSTAITLIKKETVE